MHSAQPIIFSIFYIAPCFLTSWFTPFSYIFFSLLFSHPHTSSHTPRFPLFSVLNFLSSLSFYVVFLFLLLFFLCVHLLQLTSASSHLTFLQFSLKFLTMAFLFCFIFFVRYVCLFHFFLLLFFFFFGWDFSFIVQTPCQLNLEFWLVFTKGFLIERVRRGFLVWENDPLDAV